MEEEAGSRRAAAEEAAAEQAFEKKVGVDETRRDAPAPELSRKNDKAREPEGSEREVKQLHERWLRRLPCEMATTFPRACRSWKC
jgi:hypothetical protein